MQINSFTCKMLKYSIRVAGLEMDTVLLFFFSLTSYSATLFDLKIRSVYLGKVPKTSCGGGVLHHTQRWGGGTYGPRPWDSAPPPHPMEMFLTPSLTRPFHTVPTVESLHISLQKGTTENLACEDLSDHIKKMGFATTKIKWYIVVESWPSILH